MSWRAKLPQAARVPKHEQSHEELISPPANIEEEDLSDGEASNHGRGTDDTFRTTQILEEHGIPNCLVGVSALKFYGAGRVRDWGEEFLDLEGTSDTDWAERMYQKAWNSRMVIATWSGGFTSGLRVQQTRGMAGGRTQ